jgi:hypothetical protein
MGELAIAHPGWTVAADCYGAKGTAECTHRGAPPSRGTLEQIRNLVERRMSREPVGASGKQKRMWNSCRPQPWRNVMSAHMLLDLGLRPDLGAVAVRARPGLPGLAACSESAAPRDLVSWLSSFYDNQIFQVAILSAGGRAARSKRHHVWSNRIESRFAVSAKALTGPSGRA